MDALKSLIRGFSSQVFKASILFAALAAAMVSVIGSPDHIKEIAKDSGLYDHAIQGVIDEAKDANKLDGSQDVPLDDPDVQAAIKTALPPDFIEQNANQTIDGFFGWLEGRSANPEFSIDLQDAKSRVATQIADVAYDRAKTLQTCTAEQQQALGRTGIDVFTIPCVPAGTDLEAERQNLINGINDSGEVLEDPTISTTDLPRQNGETVFERLDAVPDVYAWLKRLPWILGAVAILSAALLYVLHKDKRRAFLVIARALIITGAILLLIALASRLLIEQVEPSGDAFQATVLNLVQAVSSQLRDALVWFGGGYTLAGAGILIALHLTKPKILEQTPPESEVSMPSEPAIVSQNPVDHNNPPDETTG